MTFDYLIHLIMTIRWKGYKGFGTLEPREKGGTKNKKNAFLFKQTSYILWIKKLFFVGWVGQLQRERNEILGNILKHKYSHTPFQIFISPPIRWGSSPPPPYFAPYYVGQPPPLHPAPYLITNQICLRLFLLRCSTTWDFVKVFKLIKGFVWENIKKILGTPPSPLPSE